MVWTGAGLGSLFEVCWENTIDGKRFPLGLELPCLLTMGGLTTWVYTHFLAITPAR